MEELKPFLDLLADTINLTIVALMCLGYLLKYTEQVRNQFIPLVLWGVAITVTPYMLALTPGMTYSHAIVEGFLRGTVYTVIAWTLHNKLLKKYLDPKLP